MKALYGKILVRSYANQKDAIQINGPNGQKIELWVGKNYLTNYRERNPVICEVVHNNSKYDYIKEGDNIIVHHNLLSEWKTNPFCIEYNAQTGEGLYSFRADERIFCKLNPDGTATPVCGNILAERLKNPIKTTHIIIPDTVKQQYNDRVRVLSVSPEVEGIYAGQTVLMYDKSDYEICFTWNKVEHTLIKVFHENIIGVATDN